jgi:hypothetical protein
MKSNALLPLVALISLSAASSAQTVQAPRFEVDPFWPRPLPTHTILGSVTGLTIDAQDHVWVVNLTNSFVTRTESGADQDPPIGECCFPASAVLEFDATGKLVGHWGGPGQGYTWPMANHGIAIDKSGNVWISGNGPRDTQILQFTRDGMFLKAFGVAAPAATAAPSATAPDTAYAGVSGAQRGGGGAGRGRGATVPPLPANSAATDMFGGATKVTFDFDAAEAYVADGSRNHRIAVIDLNTGAIKRSWGAYGKAPTDNPATPYTANNAQFGNPVRCAELSRDGMVYVCDQQNNRIQVFRKSGEFVKEKSVAPATKGAGSVWDIAFSRDPQQRYLYVADGQNMKVRILDRNTLDEVSTFGDGGRYPGQFFAVHSIATDSKGNVFTAETLEGKRIQKFEFLGIKSGPKNQGTVPQKKGGSR